MALALDIELELELEVREFRSLDLDNCNTMFNKWRYEKRRDDVTRRGYKAWHALALNDVWLWLPSLLLLLRRSSSTRTPSTLHTFSFMIIRPFPLPITITLSFYTIISCQGDTVQPTIVLLK